MEYEYRSYQLVTEFILHLVEENEDENLIHLVVASFHILSSFNHNLQCGSMERISLANNKIYGFKQLQICKESLPS